MLARLVVAACACTFGANEPQRFGALHLTVDLGQGAAALSEVRLGRGASGADLQEWTAKLDTVPLRLALRSWSRAEFETLLAPPDVVEVVEWNLANDDREAKRPSTFTFDSTRAVTGPFGCVDYAWLGIATRFDGTRATATLLDFAGITPEFGWDLWIESSTPLTAPQVERLVSALCGAVRYDGPRLDPDGSVEAGMGSFKRYLERIAAQHGRAGHPTRDDLEGALLLQGSLGGPRGAKATPAQAWRDRTPITAEERRAFLQALAEARKTLLCDSSPHATQARVAVRAVLTALNYLVIRRP